VERNDAADNLTPLDRELLNLLQSEFPLTGRPFAQLGGRLGLGEEEVIARVAALKECGVIRRIGGIFNSARLGFTSTLVALQVEEEKLCSVASAVSAYPGVTHNYRREHDFNLWFTLVTASGEELHRTLKEIESFPGVRVLRNLPALRLFKIGVNFDMTDNGEANGDET
jgi:DNA-binding Lrp family transcriptional regulator